MTALENIAAAINNIAAKIAEVSANPKPNYSLDGESYSWADYLKMLTEQITELRQAQAVLSSPYEIRSRGVT